MSKSKLMLICPKEMAEMGAELARGLGLSRNRFLIEAIRFGYAPAAENLRQSQERAIDSHIDAVIEDWQRWEREELAANASG